MEQKTTAKARAKSATNAELLTKWDVNYGRLSEFLTDMVMENIPSVKTWTPSEAPSIRKNINRDVRSWLGKEYGSADGTAALAAAKTALEGKVAGGEEQQAFFENSDYRNTTLLLYFKDGHVQCGASKTALFEIDQRMNDLPPWRDGNDDPAVFISADSVVSWSLKARTAECVVFARQRNGKVVAKANAGHESFDMYADAEHTTTVPAIVIYIPDLADMYFPTEVKAGNIFGRFYRPNGWREALAKKAAETAAKTEPAPTPAATPAPAEKPKADTTAETSAQPATETTTPAEGKPSEEAPAASAE